MHYTDGQLVKEAKSERPNTYISQVTQAITRSLQQREISLRMRACRFRKLSTRARNPVDIALVRRIDTEVELFAILEVTIQTV